MKTNGKHPNDDPRPQKGKSSGLAQKWKRATPETAGMLADWDTCDGEALRALVMSVTRVGAAIMFGYSLDRGAYLVTILDGPDRHKEWIPCTADITSAVWDLVERTNS